RDDGTSPNFAAGAGSCRDGDKRSERGPVGFVIEPRQFKAGAFGQQPRGLARIQRAAAADGDNPVAVIRAKRFRCLNDVPLDRVWMNAVVEKPVSGTLFFSERLLKSFKGLGAEEPGVGDNQRALNPQSSQSPGQGRKRARAKQCGGGKRKTGQRHIPCGQILTS